MDSSGHIRELEINETPRPDEQALTRAEAEALRTVELGQRVTKLAEMRKRDHHNQRRRARARNEAKAKRLGR